MDYVKHKVYASKVTGVEYLMTRIGDVVTTIDTNMLDRTWKETEYRQDVLRSTRGAHIGLC